MGESRQQLSRFAAIFAGGTMLSRVLGLVRDMILGAYIPDVSRDAFLFAFKLPNMLRDMLGEGAANAAFVPVLSESQERQTPEEFRALVSAAMSAMIILFGVLTVGGVLAMPLLPAILELLRPLTGADPKDTEQIRLTIRLMQWTFPYLFLIGMAVFAMGPLFTVKHYSTPSWSPVLLNLSLIATCLAFHRWFPDPAWALVIGVWLGGVAQLAAMWLAMHRHVGVWRPSFRLAHPGVARIFWLLTPVILGQATGEVNKLVDNFFAYSLEEGTVSALFYANRLVQLPLSIFGVAVAVSILPSISHAAARRDDAEIRDTLVHGLRQSFFLIAPAMTGMLLLARPIVRLLFERGHFDPRMTELTTASLIFYGLGLLSFAWVKVSVQGFYAVQNTKTPVIVASASMFLNILLNCALVGPMGYRGLALATSISFTVNFILLYVLLGNRFGPLWDAEMGVSMLRVLVATAIMGAVSYGIWWRADYALGGHTVMTQSIALALAIGTAAAVYATLCKVLRIDEFDHLLSALRRR